MWSVTLQSDNSLYTSNVTGRHLSPKRNLRSSYRAPSLQRTSYQCVVRPVLFFIVECGIARFLCACVCYARIQRSGIILTLGYPCAKFRFCRALRYWASPRRKIRHAITHSLTHPAHFIRREPNLSVGNIASYLNYLHKSFSCDVWSWCGCRLGVHKAPLDKARDR